MTKKSDKKQKDEGSMSIQDVIAFQEHLKKEADFDKPDEELTPAEQVMKSLYQNLDKEVEKAVGKDVKKDLNEKRELMDKLTKLQANLGKVTELGREIEKNLVLQYAYLLNHFQKDENNHYFVVTRKLSEHILNENTPVDERVGGAHKILEIVKAYEEKMITELRAKQEIADALLASFEKNLKEIDFVILGKDSEIMEPKYKKWLTLTKDLVKNRKKATDAIQEDLDIDKIIPKFIIDSEGDITKTMSAFDMKSKGDRMVRLANEADEAEKKIEEERSKISIDLFGQQEEYMDFGGKEDNTKQPAVSHNQLESKVWYRFLKVVYIGLWVVSLGFVALLSYASDEFGTFIIGALIVWGIMVVIKKAFFYIALGNK